MTVYIYDGTFDGLLTSIYEAYYRRENPEKILSEDLIQENFLIEKIYIDTNKEKAEKVYKAIESKISSEALRKVFYVYLSEVENHGVIIFNYLRLGFKIGKNVDLNLANNFVLEMDNVYQKVSRERHWMLGLVRFRQLDNGVFYGPIEPEHNIVGLIAPYFTRRMSNENWVIHDIRRNIAAMYNREEWIIKDIELKEILNLAEDEKSYQCLWKEYFNHISIKERTNPKLQKRNMPMKYWKYLIEK